MFLRAVGLTTAADPSLDRACDGAGGAVILPDASTGYPRDPDESAAAALPLEARAIGRIARPAVAALAEVFRADPGPRPHAVALWGPDGAGKSTAVHDLARLARAHGFIPIAARFITSAYAELWRGRHLLIVEEDAETIDIRGLLHGVLQTAHAHVLIITMCEEARGLDAIRLDRVDPGRLIAAVDPPASDAGAIEHLRRAAAGARGLPGRFVRAIQPQTSLRRSRPAGLPRAAEPEATFAAADQLETTRPSSDTTGTWPAPGELAALRRRMEAAVADARAGRHSRAVRLLRQSVGALARRGDWVSAGEGSAARPGLLRNRRRRGRRRATRRQGSNGETGSSRRR